MRGRPAVAVVAAAVVVFGLGLGASEARPGGSDQVTLSMLALPQAQAGLQVLVPNFERVYPNITVNVTYVPNAAVLYQLETTELAAGNGPDLLSTIPGCGTPVSICVLAKAGELAPMVDKRWLRWSLPLVISADKYGQGLFAFTPTLALEGIFTNDTLFKKLGLKVPRTFAQLLDVCQKAKAGGAVALLLDGAGPGDFANLIVDIAVATVYGRDRSWVAEQRAGKVSFEGTPGWHQALQEVIDMDNAGCFEPGAAGTPGGAQLAALFAQGQSLMVAKVTSGKGEFDAANPSFTYTAHPFPGGAAPGQTMTFLGPANSVSVNAHASAQNQAAAQSFVDFIARPKQDALFAQLGGGLTQYEFLHGQVPAFMSDYAPVLTNHLYVVNPQHGWWNPNVLLTLQQDDVGLLTGQRSIDDILNAMDAAWRQGPE
jgi:raffinose/stachyose/melibiose transport system substrate-binding protein